MTTTTTSTKAIHEAKIAALSASTYEDGTYDLDTMTTVEFEAGYQVSFCQIGDDYTDDDYEFLVAMFKEVSDGTVYAGKFECTPEISFHFTSKALAIAYAKKFNQISIWDWSKGDQILTGGTGTR